jgi:Fe-S cluster assembly ATP-binding protein
MLKIKNLHVEFDGKQILNGLTLSVGAGEVHAIMGPNGAGKSTLSDVIAQAPSPRRGEGVEARKLLGMGLEGMAGC